MGRRQGSDLRGTRETLDCVHGEENRKSGEEACSERHRDWQAQQACAHPHKASRRMAHVPCGTIHIQARSGGDGIDTHCWPHDTARISPKAARQSTSHHSNANGKNEHTNKKQGEKPRGRQRD